MPTKATQSISKNVPITLKEDWWLFCDSYLSLSELACRELISHKYKMFNSNGEEKGPIRFWAWNLYIPMIYNLKHSIEIFLKYFLILIEDKIPEFGKDGHDIEKYLKLFQKKHEIDRINKVIKKAYQDKRVLKYSLDYAEMETNYHKEWVENVATLSIKYFQCEDIKPKIKDIGLRDVVNDGFRYPDNKLKIQLNYSEIVHLITKDDIQIILKDINELRNAFSSLRFLIAVDKEIKNGYAD
jgi:hypothetical protein